MCISITILINAVTIFWSIGINRCINIIAIGGRCDIPCRSLTSDSTNRTTKTIGIGIHIPNRIRIDCSICIITIFVVDNSVIWNKTRFYGSIGVPIAVAIIIGKIQLITGISNSRITTIYPTIAIVVQQVTDFYRSWKHSTVHIIAITTHSRRIHRRQTRLCKYRRSIALNKHTARRWIWSICEYG